MRVDYQAIGRLRHLLCRFCCHLILTLTLGVGSVAAATQLHAAEFATSHRGVRDFVAYWASAQLLIAGRDPYSPTELFKIQKAVGLLDDAPLVMWNPPWTFAVTSWLGLLDFEAGQFLWLLLNLFALLFSVQLLWQIFGGSNTSHRLAFLLAVTFVPSIFVIVIGQITPLVLASLTGFLYFERRRSDFAAGAVLALSLVKPHFLYLFWIVLAFWIIERRRWSLLGGLVCVGLVAAAMPLTLNPAVYHHYVALFAPTDLRLPLDLPAPTLRNVVQLLLEVDLRAAQDIFSYFAAGWAIYYWRRFHLDWQWTEAAPLLLMVSLATSAYAWTFDQVVFLPAVMHGASWLAHQRIRWYKSIAALLYLTINLTHATSRFFVAEELWYFWLSPAMLATYLVFRWEVPRH